MTRVLSRAGAAGVVVLALVLGVSLAACGAQVSPSASAPGSAGPRAPVSPVVGLVQTIDSAGLSNVKGFTLRTADGDVLTFVIGHLENETQFPPGHLGEHQALAAPVRVFFRSENGQLVVYRLEDA